MLANLNVPESSWMADVLYPLEGAESLAAIASSSVIFWVFLTLVPEYCLTLMGNADTMGVPTLGKFIALVSILPVVFLLPFAFFYWLQYLGRVLVASAMGETIPPRLPDRNFDGFLNGMGPWLIWSVLGLVPGLLPLILYGLTLSTASEGSSLVALALSVARVALYRDGPDDDVFARSFHGRDTAGGYGCHPPARRSLRKTLFNRLARRSRSAQGRFSSRSCLRTHHFWLYLVACLGCWVLVDWILVVVMRVLGTYYDRHKQALLWNRERPRWGVIWKL